MRNLTLMTAILALTSSVAVGETVRIGTQGSNPPYSFVNDNGAVDGFERELGDAVCVLAQVDCEWVTNDLASIIPNLISGDYDAIMAGISRTPEADALIDFTADYSKPEPSNFIGLVEPLSDRWGKGIIASLKGSIHAQSIITNTGHASVEFDTLQEAVAAVHQGEVDTVYAFKRDLLPLIAESDGKLALVSEDNYRGKGVAMGFRKDDVDLRFLFEDALYAMMQDGSLNSLIRKWFGEDASLFD